MMPRLTKFLDNFEMYVCYVLIVALAVLLSVQVFNRYIFQTSFVWLEEIVRLSFVWMIYFTVAGAARGNSHVRVELIDLFVPPSAVRIVTKVADVITIVFCLAVVWIGIDLVKASARFGDASPVTDIPMSYIYSVIPICFGLIAIRTLQSILSGPKGAPDGPLE